jgi:polyferredoxin
MYAVPKFLRGGVIADTLFDYMRFILLSFVFLAATFVIPRFFCRYICPLGAMMAPFNKISLLSIQLDAQRCKPCSYCANACSMRAMRIKKISEMRNLRVSGLECCFCLECVASCPENALALAIKGKEVYKGNRREWWRK